MEHRIQKSTCFSSEYIEYDLLGSLIIVAKYSIHPYITLGNWILLLFSLRSFDICII